MSVIRWPEPFNERGRLGEGETARATGKSTLAGEFCRCPQTLHVILILTTQKEIFLRWTSLF